MTKKLRLVTNISQTEFEGWLPALKVIVHDHARRFAAVSHEASSQKFAISWRSEIVDPVVVTGGYSELWIGVDQHVVCIANEGNVIVSINLASSLLNIICFQNCVVVLCETEVVLFNTDQSIRKIQGLHDIPNDITECYGNLIVTFEDGTQQIVNP
jgi:hypothetical protein